MFKKIVKLSLIVLCIGFSSVFVRGFTYHTSKSDKIVSDTEVSSSKQEMIDDDIISDLIDNEETEENTSTNITTSNVESSNSSQDTNIKQETTSNQNNNSNVKTNNSISTNQNQEISKKEVKETETTSTTSTSNSYIGVPNPNDFYYSFHHGKINYPINEYPTIDQCLKDSATISLIDTVDIINSWCIDVVDSQGTLLGQFLYINCQSGNCDRYKVGILKYE